MLEAGTVELSKILLLPRNPRDHDLGTIYESNDEHGILRRVLINKRTGHCIAGNGNVKSYRQRKLLGEPPPENAEVRPSDGEWIIPCDYTDIPEDREEAVALALNYESPDDRDTLAEVVSDLAAQGQLRGTGWDEEMVDSFVRSVQMEYEEPPNFNEANANDGGAKRVACPECGAIFKLDYR